MKAIGLEDIEEATNNFDPNTELGSGGYRTVYKGTTPSGQVWAVKRAKVVSKQSLTEFQNEVDVVSKMSHRHLVRLLGYCDEADEQILVYEYVAQGTPKEHLRPRDFSPTHRYLTFEERLEIAVGAAWGLHYLHNFAKSAIIHCDIKSDNILIDHAYKPRSQTLGFSNTQPRQGRRGETRGGLRWLALQGISTRSTTAR